MYVSCCPTALLIARDITIPLSHFHQKRSLCNAQAALILQRTLHTSVSSDSFTTPIHFSYSNNQSPSLSLLPPLSRAMSRGNRTGYDAFNEPLGSTGHRRSDDEYDAYSANHGPGSGLQAFYNNNKRRIFICLGVSVAVIILIAIIAAVAGKKGGSDGPAPPGPQDQWITIATLPAYRVGTDPRVLLYIPDVNGRRQAAINLVTKYGESGFSTYLLDPFNGGVYNSSAANAPVMVAQRVRDAVAVLRQQDHVTSIHVTGYGWGAAVAVLLADGTGGIDSAVAAYPSFAGYSAAEATAFINNISIPVFFVMVHTQDTHPLHTTQSTVITPHHICRAREPLADLCGALGSVLHCNSRNMILRASTVLHPLTSVRRSPPIKRSRTSRTRMLLPTSQ